MIFEVGTIVRTTNRSARTGEIISFHPHPNPGEDGFYYRVKFEGHTWAYDEDELIAVEEPNNLLKDLL